MSDSWWLFEVNDTRWLIGRTTADGQAEREEVELPSGANPEQIAETLHQALVNLDYSGEPVLLGLASDSVLVGTIEVGQGKHASDPQSLVYQLEEVLPLSAEEIVADFYLSKQGGTTLGVAVETARLAPLIAELATREVPVVSISPIGLLAAQGLVQREEMPAEGWLLWQHGDRAELLLIADGGVAAWQSMQAIPSVLLRQIQFQRLHQAGLLSLTLVNVAREIEKALSDLAAKTEDFQIDPNNRPYELFDLAGETSEQILTGATIAPIELRSDQLGGGDRLKPLHRSIQFAIVAAACLLICMAASLLVQASRYRALADSHVEQQEKAFCEAFSDQRVPSGIHSRLASEHARLVGLHGQGGDTPFTPSALATLHQALAALPSETRLRSGNLRIEGERLFFEAEVRAHRDADLLAAALRQAGFEVAQPRTEQAADGVVAVVFTADWMPSSTDREGASP